MTGCTRILTSSSDSNQILSCWKRVGTKLGLKNDRATFKCIEDLPSTHLPWPLHPPTSTVNSSHTMPRAAKNWKRRPSVPALAPAMRKKKPKPAMVVPPGPIDQWLIANRVRDIGQEECPITLDEARVRVEMRMTKVCVCTSYDNGLTSTHCGHTRAKSMTFSLIRMNTPSISQSRSCVHLADIVSVQSRC